MTPARKLLTEREAWLTMAAAWDEPDLGLWGAAVADCCDRRAPGLCSHIKILGQQGKISFATMLDMLDKIERHTAKMGKSYYQYLWPRTIAGAGERAKFCRARAKAIRRKS